MERLKTTGWTLSSLYFRHVLFHRKTQKKGILSRADKQLSVSADGGRIHLFIGHKDLLHLRLVCLCRRVPSFLLSSSILNSNNGNLSHRVPFRVESARITAIHSLHFISLQFPPQIPTVVATATRTTSGARERKQ